ncbi:SIR2 family protein [Streptomyces luteogriseus]|uniref:SIR2 family protein n=1 Tax=Streptomyces luteogriseus TaxID=68233 RepID=UPI002E36A23B|nr:SIR2 family protein [Streptomyces luteogriseus]WTJ28983.1 SIR2 family protein [Streptomyces luteogriseus]
MHLPSDLVSAFRGGRGAVFVGAGASVDAGLPTWQQFVTRLALELDIEPGPDGGFPTTELNKIPQYYENRFNRRLLLSTVRELLGDRRNVRSEVHRLLARLPCTTFYTTNYDELLEDALRDQGQRFSVVASEEAARASSDIHGHVVRKIHGTLSQPQTLIITRDDYARFVNANSVTINTLQSDLIHHMFLFVGYSLSDPDFNNIYDNVLYNMGNMAQTHYLCVPHASAMEIDDLARRGIKTIDLSGWPGANPSEQLKSFLSDLANATSDLVHIERFFKGLRNGDRVPLVISSTLNDGEQFVFYPDCDVRVAQQVERALERMGVSTRWVADQVALEEADTYMGDNVVLICSPFGNKFTRRVFEELGPGNICVRFCHTDGKRFIQDLKTAREYIADDPSKSPGNAEMSDYCVVARYRNPWNPSKHIYLFAGIYAIGTHAISQYLSNLMNYRHLPDDPEDSVALLRVSFVDHDPYNYDYEVALHEIL